MIGFINKAKAELYSKFTPQVFQRKVKILEKRIIANNSGNLGISKEFKNFIRDRNIEQTKQASGAPSRLANILSSINSLQQSKQLQEPQNRPKRTIHISSNPKYYIPTLALDRNSWTHKSRPVKKTNKSLTRLEDSPYGLNTPKISSSHLTAKDLFRTPGHPSLPKLPSLAKLTSNRSATMLKVANSEP